MARTVRTFTVPPARVLDVLADGWSYARWVVGAKRIRSVDDTWPEPGSRFHHSVGIGLLTIDDRTEVERFDRHGDRGEVVLGARAWPAGKARVAITVEPADGGSRVTMDEVPVAGPGKVIHNPVLDRLIDLRNLESLRRLERVAG